MAAQNTQQDYNVSADNVAKLKTAGLETDFTNINDPSSPTKGKPIYKVMAGGKPKAILANEIPEKTDLFDRVDGAAQKGDIIVIRKKDGSYGMVEFVESTENNSIKAWGARQNDITARDRKYLLMKNPPEGSGTTYDANEKVWHRNNWGSVTGDIEIILMRPKGLRNDRNGNGGGTDGGAPSKLDEDLRTASGSFNNELSHFNEMRAEAQAKLAEHKKSSPHGWNAIITKRAVTQKWDTEDTRLKQSIKAMDSLSTDLAEKQSELSKKPKEQQLQFYKSSYSQLDQAVRQYSEFEPKKK